MNKNYSLPTELEWEKKVDNLGFSNTSIYCYSDEDFKKHWKEEIAGHNNICTKLIDAPATANLYINGKYKGFIVTPNKGTVISAILHKVKIKKFKNGAIEVHLDA